MELATSATTAAVALLGVGLGGWLTGRNQDRTWRREHASQWRDIRLSAYGDFVSAYRQFVAFAMEPGAKITAKPNPRNAGKVLPFFDAEGRPYKERLEAAAVRVLVVSESSDTMRTSNDVVESVRRIAAARATHSETDVPHDVFVGFITAQKEFLSAVRRDLDLPEVLWEAIFLND
jgi:hypothetical protein